MVSQKTLESLDQTSVEQDEELAFIEYQEEVTHSREEKRNRVILVLPYAMTLPYGLDHFHS